MYCNKIRIGEHMKPKLWRQLEVDQKRYMAFNVHNGKPLFELEEKKEFARDFYLYLESFDNKKTIDEIKLASHLFNLEKKLGLKINYDKNNSTANLRVQFTYKDNGFYCFKSFHDELFKITKNNIEWESNGRIKLREIKKVHKKNKKINLLGEWNEFN